MFRWTSPAGREGECARAQCRVLGALTTVGILLKVGVQAAVPFLAGEDVRASFAQKRDLVAPADDDPRPAHGLEIGVLARVGGGVEHELAAVDGRDADERGLRAPSGPSVAITASPRRRTNSTSCAVAGGDSASGPAKSSRSPSRPPATQLMISSEPTGAMRACAGSARTGWLTVFSKIRSSSQ